MPKQPSMRMCIACKELFNKKDLNRIVRTPAGDVLFDKTGKAAGRGAYLCNNPDCLKLCVKNRLLNKSFKTPVSQEAYDLLLTQNESK
ncbi:MAG: YlxR family protein [Clostridia bacterium]|nr:YlxR family protein [Clostridia bacterium]